MLQRSVGRSDVADTLGWKSTEYGALGRALQRIEHWHRSGVAGAGEMLLEAVRVEGVRYAAWTWVSASSWCTQRRRRACS